MFNVYSIYYEEALESYTIDDMYLDDIAEEGIGSFVANGIKKIFAWLKQKAEQLKAWFKSLFDGKGKPKHRSNAAKKKELDRMALAASEKQAQTHKWNKVYDDFRIYSIKLLECIDEVNATRDRYRTALLNEVKSSDCPNDIKLLTCLTDSPEALAYLKAQGKVEFCLNNIQEIFEVACQSKTQFVIPMDYFYKINDIWKNYIFDTIAGTVDILGDSNEIVKGTIELAVMMWKNAGGYEAEMADHNGQSLSEVYAKISSAELAIYSRAMTIAKMTTGHNVLD